MSDVVVEHMVPQGAKRLEVDLGEGYEAFIIEDRYNPVIKRRELRLRILHVGKPTPSRIKVRMQLAKALSVDVKRLYIRKIVSTYGVGVTDAEVHVYDTPERALQFEPKYIIERNMLPEEAEG